METVMRLPAEVEDAFWANVQVSKADACWLWTGGTSGNYGAFHTKETAPSGRPAIVGAHRVAKELLLGRRLPTEVWVLHECDTPLCVNPNHLFLGDQAANDADREAKGRTSRGESHSLALRSSAIFAATQRGVANHQSKVNEAVVREIRERRATGERWVSIARHFGLHHSTVMDIVARKTWNHVK